MGELCLQTKNAFYGLKQSPRAWHEKIAEYWSGSAFYSSKANMKVESLIYVDNLLIGRDSSAGITKVKRSLEQKFHMKVLSELKNFLAIEILRSENGILVR